MSSGYNLIWTLSTYAKKNIFIFKLLEWDKLKKNLCLDSHNKLGDNKIVRMKPGKLIK